MQLLFKLAHIHIDGTCIHTTLSRNWGRRSCRFTRPLWKRLGSSKSETEDSFLRSRATRGSFLFSPCKYEQYSHRLGSFSSSSWVPVKRISSFTVVNYPNKAIYLCQGQEHGCLSLVLFSPLLLCLLFLSFFLSSSSLYSFLGNRLFLLSILFFFFSSVDNGYQLVAGSWAYQKAQSRSRMLYLQGKEDQGKSLSLSDRDLEDCNDTHPRVC